MNWSCKTRMLLSLETRMSMNRQDSTWVPEARALLLPPVQSLLLLLLLAVPKTLGSTWGEISSAICGLPGLSASRALSQGNTDYASRGALLDLSLSFAPDRHSQFLTLSAIPIGFLPWIRANTESSSCDLVGCHKESDVTIESKHKLQLLLRWRPISKATIVFHDCAESTAKALPEWCPALGVGVAGCDTKDSARPNPHAEGGKVSRTLQGWNDTLLSLSH